MVETRIERNRKYRKNKKRFYLFIFITIVFFIASILKINHSYSNLVGNSQSTEIFDINIKEGSVGIVLLGNELYISKDMMQNGLKILKNGYKKVVYLAQNFIEKIGH
ncbi:hypothetical protein SAMN02745973_02238 [Garciella nitratireducens DSM 15102]|uniref:Uncharacterized protein n=1 Tax=Garciella nitratireducens DSM 15102 TaxID=1121911 RepID=A0A1T4PXQ2_9FIRM|nr:hypothetical protein SAMN02745973_02238 [Garciella nitratireducens DSM 15102]